MAPKTTSTTSRPTEAAGYLQAPRAKTTGDKTNYTPENSRPSTDIDQSTFLFMQLELDSSVSSFSQSLEDVSDNNSNINDDDSNSLQSTSTSLYGNDAEECASVAHSTSSSSGVFAASSTSTSNALAGYISSTSNTHHHSVESWKDGVRTCDPVLMASDGSLNDNQHRNNESYYYYSFRRGSDTLRSQLMGVCLWETDWIDLEKDEKWSEFEEDIETCLKGGGLEP